MKHLSHLLPGQRVQLFVPTDISTVGLTVSLQNVALAPPARQNQVFGDSLSVTVLDAPTSEALTLVSDFPVADTSYSLAFPQSGLIRVAVGGANNNAAPVSADVVIDRQRMNPGPPIAFGTLGELEQDTVQFQVPPGKSQLSVVLSWLHDWGAYPANDLDFILLGPDGSVNIEGADEHSPERAVVVNPAPGVWTAFVFGFQVNQTPVSDQDLWTLRASADGQSLQPVH